MHDISQLESKLKYCFPRLDLCLGRRIYGNDILEISRLTKLSVNPSYPESLDIILEYAWKNRQFIYASIPQDLPLKQYNHMHYIKNNTKNLQLISQKIYDASFCPEYSHADTKKNLPIVFFSISRYSEILISSIVWPSLDNSNLNNQLAVKSIAKVCSVYFTFCRSIHGVKHSHHSEILKHFNSFL